MTASISTPRHSDLLRRLKNTRHECEASVLSSGLLQGLQGCGEDASQAYRPRTAFPLHSLAIQFVSDCIICEHVFHREQGP